MTNKGLPEVFFGISLVSFCFSTHILLGVPLPSVTGFMGLGIAFMILAIVHKVLASR